MRPDEDCPLCGGTGVYEACISPPGYLCDAPYYELVDAPCMCTSRREPEPAHVTPIELVLT